MRALTYLAKETMYLMTTSTKETTIMKKYLYPAIGAAAFVIGGIVAREKALDVAETLENTFNKKKSETEDEE